MQKFLFFILMPIASCSQSVRVDKFDLQQVFMALGNRDLTKTKVYIIDSIDKFSTKHITQEKVLYKIAELKELKDGLWSNVIFDSAKIVNRHFLIDSLSSKDRFKTTPPHYWFSLPYFNKDKTAFIIYYDYYCGYTCGQYSVRLYKKINGKWTFIKSFFEMVS